MASSFQDLRVWQEAIKFAIAIYGVTEKFPKHELYGLTNELQTQLIIARELKYLLATDAEALLGQAAVVARALNALINAVRPGPG